MSTPNAFDADGSTVSELLNRNGQGFYIPIYQRAFTWSSDDVDQLLEDLLLGTTAAADAKPSSVLMFIGSVIVLSDKSAVDPPCAATPANVLHVIDGQQRLTTLVLICAELYIRTWKLEEAVSARPDVASNAQAAWISKRLKRSLKLLLDTISFETDTVDEGLYSRAPRLIRQGTDLWGDDLDSIQYESNPAWYIWEVLKQRDAGDVQGVPGIVERATFFEILRVIGERLDAVQAGATKLTALDALATPVPSWAAALSGDEQPLGGTQDLALDEALRLVTLISYVQVGLLFIDVRAPSAENAFALFEPLNTSGQMLTPLETLKPAVIRVEGGVQKYMDSNSKKHMDRLDELFPPTDEKARKSVADFIGTTALADKGEGRIGKSLQPQRRYLRQRLQIDLVGRKGDQRRFIKSLADDAEFFTEAVRQKGTPAHLASASEADRLYFRVLQESRHSIAFPLLARYQAVQTKAGRVEYLEVMRAVAGFFALWRTSRSSTAQIDDIHRDLMSIGHPATSLPPLARWNSTTGAASSALPPAADVKKALAALLRDRGKIPNKQTWVTRMSAQNLYDNAKILSRLLLLAAHDDAIPATPAGQIRRGTSGCYPTLTLAAWEQLPTVEHIAPQSPMSADTSYEAAIYDNDLVGHLGNLTLLPQDLNNLVENRPWDIKRQFFDILGESDPQQRAAQVSGLVLPQGQTLGKKAQVNLLDSDFMSLTPFVARRKVNSLTREFVDRRSRVLGGLAWDRLHSLLT